MNQLRFFNQKKTYHICLAAVCVVISVAIVFILFIVLVKLYNISSYETRNLFILLLSIISILMAAVFYMLVLICRRFARERTYLNELNKFKIFFDSLHHTSAEDELYEVLYNFLRNKPFFDNITVFYNIDASSEDVTWQKYTDMEVPLCNMCPENCPVIVSGNEYSVESIKSIHDCCPYQLPEYKFGSYLCIPVTYSDITENIAQFYSRKEHAFTPSTVSEIKSYIEIARAILNIKKTMNVLNKNATTDRLTNVYNRSFLEPYLENQIEAANLSKQQISVIMVDMDHFKAINDSYGHAVGDYVLTVFAQIILKCVRKTDLIARLGGDEFIVVLPSTNTETAEIIAERIRHEVADAHIPPYNNIIIPSISCSVGISTYPAFCDSKEALLLTSDIALYKAKQSGRNCIRTYRKEAANA